MPKKVLWGQTWPTWSHSTGPRLGARVFGLILIINKIILPKKTEKNRKKNFKKKFFFSVVKNFWNFFFDSKHPICMGGLCRFQKFLITEKKFFFFEFLNEFYPTFLSRYTPHIYLVRKPLTCLRAWAGHMFKKKFQKKNIVILSMPLSLSVVNF